MRPPTPARHEAEATVDPRLAVAAVLTFAAGVVHVAAAVPHFDDVLLGSAFMVTGWAQILVAAFLLRPHPARGVVWGAVATHGAALGALVAARTVGLPVGHGGIEPITLPDATTAALQIVGLAVLLTWLRRPHRLETSRPVLLATLGLAGLLALGGSGLAVASLGTSGHGHDDDGPVAGASEAEADGPHGAGTSDDTVHLPAVDEDRITMAPTPAGAGDGEAGERTTEEPSSDGHGHAPGEGH